MARPVRGHPCFAAVYDWLTGPWERAENLARRRALLAPCAGDVLDAGCGTGANLPVFAELARAGRTLRVQAADPDPHMLRRAGRRAARLGLPVRLLDAPAEDLPLADASCDFVACTLVLCTAGRPAAALAELARVLRPGGRLLFLEHVGSGHPRAAALQARLRRPWACLAGGCRLDAATDALLRAAPFAEVHWEEEALPPPLYRLLRGWARKA